MKILSPGQVKRYHDEGYLVIDSLIRREWLDRLRRVVGVFIERSKNLTESTPEILLAPGHDSDSPRLRRIPQTVMHDEVFRTFGLEGPIVDVAEDLLGPDVRFHHSKLNFKWPAGGEAIRWHQDIQFWPHTNYSPLTIGVYLEDVDESMAPMGVVRGSHLEPLSTLRDEHGTWLGALPEPELSNIDRSRIRWCTGQAGTVTVHNCRVIHGSEPNHSSRMRPLLLHTYSAADSLPVTGIMNGVPFSGQIVRGQPPSRVRFDAEPCPLPPDWGRGEYSSIFASQQKS